MLAAFAVAAGLAVADSLNPATIGQASVLAVGRRPLRATLSFWAGAFLCYLVLGVVLVLGPGRLVADLFRPPPELFQVGQVLLGAAALVVAAVLWRRRRTLRLGHRLIRGDADLAFRLGALVTLADLPTAFPYYGLVTFLATSGLPRATQLAVLLVYTFIYLLPVLAILALRAVSGPRAEARLRGLRELVEREAVAVAAVVALIIGCLLLGHAVVTGVVL
jgi:cytochrome c biogenesis protein CcdA